MRKMKSVVAAAVAFLAFAIAVDNIGQLAAGADDERKTVRLFLKKVRVSETNKDGNPWDVNNGRPDLVVRIKNLSDNTVKEWSSQEKSDTFEATFDVATVVVEKGQKIQIEVVDKDVAANDLIGRTSFELTKDMINKKGATEISFELVKALTLEFRNP
jgi:hypothetical protein